MTEVKHLYSPRAEERRKQFNNIIKGIDMVLMNKIPEISSSVWENWEAASPLGNDECQTEPTGDDQAQYRCTVHDRLTNDEFECEDHEEDDEVYQWFAINDGDADFLARNGQYVTYSHSLETYFLAICHMGTSWDYVESMVEAFNNCYHGLEDFNDDGEA